MPSDALMITVTTGLGVSLIAGIISGMFFVIGYKRKISNRNRKWYCGVCGEHLRSIDTLLTGSNYVICHRCDGKVCQSRCATLQSKEEWVCSHCQGKENNWIDGAFRVVEPIKKALRLRMSFLDETRKETDDDSEAEGIREREHIRDLIERLVNDLLGDNVDDASINKIYDDPNYLPAIGESPCSAHDALKLFIHKLIREASELPRLRGEATTNVIDQEDRTYEDLLSTAILNKVISSSQGTPSRATSVCSHRSSSSRRRNFQKEYFFGEERLDNKWKNIDTDTASVSSLEEWVHSDSSLGSTKYVDRISLTIKQRIEEGSSSDSEPEQDDAEYFRNTSSYGSAEPNWFLQKRRFRSAISPVPVPMLVPDPTVEAKVLIGDKQLDETSDLSDVASDFEDEHTNAMDITGHLIGSKTLIGGKNPLLDLSEDEVSADSGVKECKDLDDETDIFRGNVVDSSISSESSGNNMEKDTEYTEKYATLPRTILIEKSERIGHGNDEHDKRAFEGVYSKREKEKWKNAVELKNNPYSKENIERRIKTNSVNSLFGSDYYVREARAPSGTTKDEVHNNENENCFLATPVFVEDSLDACPDTIDHEETPFSPEISDSDISLVNCYDVTKSVIYQKLCQENDEIQTVEQFFDFESMETSIQSEVKAENKPIAKPRKKLSEQVTADEVHTEQIQENLLIKQNEIDKDLEALEEIERLKEQKLVVSRIREFSKSMYNLSELEHDNPDNKIKENSKETKRRSRELHTSVKDLKKIFEQSDVKRKNEKPILYSLTGRSISKQFKEKLRDYNGDTPSLSQLHSLSLTNLVVEESSR